MKETDNTNRAMRLERERILLRYSDALERGDLDVVGAILAQAEANPDLERVLWEMHLALGEEMRLEQEHALGTGLERDAANVAALASAHFSAPIAATPNALPLRDEEEPAPVTVGDIAADLRGRAELDAASRSLVQRLENNAEPLQSDLSARGIRALLARLGLSQASRRFVGLFQDAAFSLGLQRQDQTFRLAAARRQKTGQSPSPAQPAEGQAFLHETGTDYTSAPFQSQPSDGRPCDVEQSKSQSSDAEHEQEDMP